MSSRDIPSEDRMANSGELRYPNIAVCGNAGAGKTTLAQHLAHSFGYQVCSTGALVREISSILFGEEDRGHLNLISEALRTIDKYIWITASLRRASPDQRIVMDSIRYADDLPYLRVRGWKVVKVKADIAIRNARLAARGQVSNGIRDATHASELDLDAMTPDMVIPNEVDLKSFFDAIDRLIPTLMNIDTPRL